MTANENPGLTIDLTHDFAHDLAHPTGSKRCPNPSPKSCHYQHLLESPLHRAYNFIGLISSWVRFNSIWLWGLEGVKPLHSS